MAFHYSPKVVTNGLVLYLDAGNTKSYPGTGLTWSDLKNNTSAILVNGPTFDSSNFGRINFNGTSSRVSIPNNTLTQFATASTWSVSIAFSTGPTQSQAFPSIFGKGNSGAAGSGILLYLNRSGSKDTFVLKASNVNDLFIQKTIGTNNILTITYDNTFLRLYVNGKYYKVSSVYLQPTVETTSPVYIGFNDYYSNMSVYIFAKWDRNLSSLEVLQNYNAIKSRLFLPSMISEVNSMYIDRVTTAAGTFETNNYLDSVSVLDSKNILVDATWLLVPHSYKSGIIYSQFPNYGSNGDLTYTRSSSATRLNVNGVIETISSNIPTIDYTLGAPCLMLEPQRTNNVLYSQDFSNTYWTTSRLNGGTGSLPTITANYATAPDGTQTAARFQFALNGGTAIGDLSVINKLGIITATYGVISIWMKSNTAATYSVLLRAGGGTALLPQLVTTSWNRYNFPATNCDGIYWGLRGTFNTSDSADILAWGAQVETAASGSQNCAFVTSYIPTTSVVVTRSGSFFQLDNLITKGITGTYSGTWFIDFRNNIITTRDAAGVGTTIRNSSSDFTGISLRRGSDTNIRFGIEKCTDGVNFVNIYYTTATASKLAVTWNGTYLNIFQNGTKVISNHAFTYSTMQQFYHTSQDITKNIAQMAFFDYALTDASCISLTS